VFAGVELTAYCPIQVSRVRGHRVCIRQGARAAVEHVAVPAGPRLCQCRPHMHLGNVTVPDDAVGAADGGVSPAQDASLRAELSSSGNRLWVD
jgi:hypothetical protein